MEPNWSHYKRGSIIRIQLDNFMIYKHIVFTPGPFLNIILGPNGSGKSALVCGLIMGLGGDPQITGRSSNLVDYIRFHAKYAVITIEVYSGDPDQSNYIIQREIRLVSRNGKNESTTIWRLNKKTVQKANIVEFIKSLNIDITNLCQILPQERVVEFSRLTPKELLFSTEKSIGDADMYENHMKLIAWSNEITEIKGKIRECNSFILKYQNFKTNIEPDLRLIRKKKEFEEEISWLTKKQVWFEFEEKRMNYINFKKELENKKAEYTSFISRLRPLKAKLEQSGKFLNSLRSDKANSTEDAKKYFFKINELLRKQERYREQIDDIIRNFNERKNEQKRSRDRLAQYEQDLVNYTNELQNCTSDADRLDAQVVDAKKELDELNEQRDSVMYELETKKREQNTLASEKRMLEVKKSSVRDMLNAKIEKISMNDPSIRDAYEWFNKNKHRFSGEVFPPLITQINVLRKEWVNFVEGAIPTVDMSTFLFENVEDLKCFVDNLKKERNIRVNVAVVPRNCDIRQFRPNFDLSEYQRYGITNVVSELFTAPDLVKIYLCQTYQLHQILVGNDITDQKIQELIDNTNFRRIITNKSIYSIVVSSYDHVKTTRIDVLGIAKYLNIIIDEEKIRHIDQDIETYVNKLKDLSVVIDDLNRKSRNLNEEFDKVNKVYTSLNTRKHEISKLGTKIREKEKQVANLKQSLVSLDNHKAQVSGQISNIQSQQMNVLKEICDYLKGVAPKRKMRLLYDAKIRFATNVKLFYERHLSTYTSEERERKEELKQMDENTRKLREDAKKYREKAVNESGFDYQNLQPEIEEKMNELPSSLSEISEAINLLKLKCEGIRNVDETILEEYQKYQREIEERRVLGVSLGQRLEEREKQIQHLQPIWLQALRSLVDKINENFSSFMRYLKFCGEVYLYIANEFDFEEYGIRIKVQFRESEPMKDLDAHHQSGGERSVSTMIYMLSLQELAFVPFRVVDEINQGMDERNERCVFDLIAQVSRKNSSQYFLLSPKLLPNLNYTEEMKIHIIFNAPRCEVNWHTVLQNLNRQEKKDKKGQMNKSIAPTQEQDEDDVIED